MLVNEHDMHNVISCTAAAATDQRERAVKVPGLNWYADKKLNYIQRHHMYTVIIWREQVQRRRAARCKNHVQFLAPFPINAAWQFVANSDLSASMHTVFSVTTRQCIALWWERPCCITRSAQSGTIIESLLSRGAASVLLPSVFWLQGMQATSLVLVHCTAQHVFDNFLFPSSGSVLAASRRWH